MKTAQTVCLTMVYMAQNEVVPPVIKLDDLILPGVPPIPGWVQGFYGHSATPGMTHASTLLQEASKDLHAKSAKISVPLDVPSSLTLRVLQEENLAKTQFYHCCRLAEPLAKKLSHFWISSMGDEGVYDSVLENININWKYPEKYIPAFPQVIQRLVELPELSHIKVFIYPVKLTGNSPVRGIVYVGATRREYIEEAHMLYYPDVKIEI